jgi:hypothetical protein
VIAAGLAIGAVGLRVHEGIPLLLPFRLVLLTSYGGLLITAGEHQIECSSRSSFVHAPSTGARLFRLGVGGHSVRVIPGAAREAVQAAVPTLLTMTLVLLCAPNRGRSTCLHRFVFWAAVIAAVMGQLAGRMSEGTRLAGSAPSTQ